MKIFLLFIFPIVAILLVWESASHSSFVNPSLFPPPTQVLVALSEMLSSKALFLDLQHSLWRLVIGLCIGSASGIMLGLITGRIKLFSLIFTPIIQILRPLPPVAIAPLIVVWFGIDNEAKIFSIAFAVFFPVWLNTNIGAKQIAKEFLWTAKLCTSSSFKILLRVVLPASLPFIIAGIRTGISVGFIMVFVSELSGASNGLGYRISVAALSFRIDQMIAALITLGFLGAITDQIFIVSTRKLFPWLNFLSK
jgi:ABC-type nitrate/sulfonate/bicarbonate transport system permease component